MKCVFFKIHATVLFAILVFSQSLAQKWESELQFKNISTDDGLSNATVNCIYQDARGYIWIGTLDGLNRYDGYEMKIYRSNPNDTNSIPNNRISVLWEDLNSNLWIGTSEGLCQFNYSNEQFTNYQTNDDFNQIFDFAYDSLNNRIWMVYSTGLRYLDLEKETINVFQSDPLSHNVVYRLLIVDRELYIGTSKNGVYALNLNSFEINEFANTEGGLFQLPGNRITAFHYYAGRIFIGTGNGLVEYHFGEKTARFFSSKNSGMSSDIISSIKHDGNGDIYVGTDKGIAILDKSTDLITSYIEEEGNESSLSSNLVRSIFVDKNDDLWVGSIQRGIDYMSKESRKMTLVKKKIIQRNSLSDNNVSCFAQDAKGGIWIGTQENGLNYYYEGKYNSIKANGSENGLSNNKIQELSIDKNEVVWVGTYGGGLNSISDGKIEQYRMDKSNPDRLQSDIIKDLFIGKNGIVWMATEQGLESYDPVKNVFNHHYLRSTQNDVIKRKNIRAVKEDFEGIIYAGTNTGLYIYNPLSGERNHFQADPNDTSALGHNIINEIFEDSKNQIWLGSLGGGLIRFNRENKFFKNYSKENGFPDNSVKSIEEDENGNLWMGTNVGIVKFSPETEKAIVFGKSYGLQGNNFSSKASIKLKDGRLIFGGPDGFNVLNPNEFENEKKELNVIFTDLKIFDQSVGVRDEFDILTQNISLVKSLRISFNQSKHFSVSFSALEFSNPDQVQYAYKMKGFDDDWRYIGKNHDVSFSNLEPGGYTLRVMASNNGIWENEISRLKISIPAPWYLTIWFKVSVVMLIGSFAVLFYFYRSYNFKRNQRKLETLVAEQNKEISAQNEELQSINEELISQNEEVVKQKDFIDSQNSKLTKVQDELKMVNLTLEEKIKLRTKELEESNRTLDKAVKELDRFVYSASHDLSAPLKSILGLVNIAKLEYKDKELQVHLNYIEDSIIKQENVIKSLTQYSRNARQEIKPEPIDINEIVNQVIKDLRYIPGSELVKIHNEIREGEVIVTDEQRIKMIINNLLSNGIKYHDSKKNNAFVKIQLTRNNTSWRLIVKDNGLGIDEDQKKNIFDMFHRATEASDGSGLGLFIVNEAVERLGGDIFVDSQLKRGSIFTIELPQMQAKTS